jgi:hypothetical protein
VPEVGLPDPDELNGTRDRRFGRRVALVTAVYAVVLAIASVGGNNAMEDILLSQQQSSDQWAFYQAKVIREHLYRAEKLVVEAQVAEPAALGGPQRERYTALGQRFADEEKRYNAEKKDIEKDARRLERERDTAKQRDVYFDYAEVFLQIAIVMASVSILSTSRPMFWFSAVLAAVGTLAAANGFTLMVTIPFLH